MHATIGIILFYLTKILAEECVTPNYELAECVPAHSCHSAFHDTIEFVRQSRCGNSSEPMLCCGNLLNLVINHSNIRDVGLLSDRRYCGYRQKDDDQPWLAALMYKTYPYFNDTERTVLCSGSLINSRYVLTSAHCLKMLNTILIGVRLGTCKFRKPQLSSKNSKSKDTCIGFIEEFRIEERVPHDWHNAKTGEYDIGLIRLNRTLTFSDRIKPIYLPIPEIPTSKPGNTLVTSGWSIVNSGSHDVDGSNEITTKLITNEECSLALNDSVHSITENTMCTSYMRRNAALSHEDISGVTLISSSEQAQWQIEGISSWGRIDTGSYLGVNTRVEKYTTWIHEAMVPWE